MEDGSLRIAVQTRLELLVGSVLTASRRLGSTRELNFLAADGRSYFLVSDAPWRFTTGRGIVVGSEDSKDELTVQDRLVGDLLPPKRPLRVHRVQANRFGDLRVEFSQRGVTLEIFSTSCNEMEWMLKCPERPSVVFAEGRYHLTSPKKTAGNRVKTGTA
jgi:hypothetical protein